MSWFSPLTSFGTGLLRTGLDACGLSYQSPSDPWEVSTEAQDEISELLDESSSMYSHVRMRFVAETMMDDRVKTLPEGKMRQHLLRTLSQGFVPTIIERMSIDRYEDVNVAMQQVAHHHIGWRGSEPPTTKVFNQNISERMRRPGLTDAAKRAFRQAGLLYKALRFFDYGANLYVPSLDTILLRPEVFEIEETGLAAALVGIHETEHRIGLQAGDVFRFCNRTLLSGAMFLSLLTPFYPLAQKHLIMNEEKYAFGAQWEFLQQIPESTREQAMRSLVQTFSELHYEREDVQTLTAVGLRKKVIQEGLQREDIIKYNCAYTVYKAIQYANLDKEAYIQEMIKAFGYGFGAVFYELELDYKFMKREELLGEFCLKKGYYLAMLGAWAYGLSKLL